MFLKLPLSASVIWPSYAYRYCQELQLKYQGEKEGNNLIRNGGGLSELQNIQVHR